MDQAQARQDDALAQAREEAREEQAQAREELARQAERIRELERFLYIQYDNLVPALRDAAPQDAAPGDDHPRRRVRPRMEER